MCIIVYVIMKRKKQFNEERGEKLLNESLQGTLLKKIRKKKYENNFKGRFKMEKLREHEEEIRRHSNL